MITVVRTTPDLELKLVVNEIEARHQAEMRRRHDLVMATIRATTQAVEPAPSNNWLARLFRRACSHL